ncbi:hypothetical protein OC846_004634 [Tilletia horrida]|uniref:Transmembrane protein n=1 Tax=Tilletia horrida TaxID=155126 RepID=A0AAN6GQ32_9BASI|nr:hypothetical protein OC846_004634 [Tilletia horrida]KAK0563707.1 hypothetical protein OC861_004656 [Tilletia horrida]
MLCSIRVFILFFALTAVLGLSASIETTARDVVAVPVFHAAAAQELEASLTDFTKDKHRITSLQSHRHTPQQVTAVTQVISDHLEEHVPRWLDIRTAIDSKQEDLLQANGKAVTTRALQDVIDLVGLVLGLVLWVVRGVLRLGGRFEPPVQQLIMKAVDALSALTPPQLQTPGPSITT